MKKAVTTHEKNSRALNLLTTAKKRGYISQEEILAAYPKPEDHIEEIDWLYDQLINKSIDCLS